MYIVHRLKCCSCNLDLEHIEAEKEEEPALRTPSPDSDEPTEGNLLI